MDLFEYQGKQYFVRYGIPVPAGGVADTAAEAVAQADAVGYPVVVKAQVQVGGRGKAGGIRRADNADEVRAHATAILGMDIKGHVVKRLWIERASDIAREYYASFTLDRRAKLHPAEGGSRSFLLGIVSARGGVDIEQVAAEDPDAIARQHINPLDGLTEDAARHLVDVAGLDDAARSGAVAILRKLYRCFTEGDADLTEINPLILTRDGAVLALDAKVSLDPSAAFRHPEWAAFEAAQVLDEREQLAREKGLIYIGLDGSVGIIGNGAGLVMSTLDVVTQVGGRAANFLDLGGGASADVVSNALEVINTDENVRSIFLNIFGGITRGDEVAKGIIAALERVDVKAPIVIRLDGTNADQGRALLDDYASNRLISRSTMVEAARTAVQLAGGGR